MEPHTRTADNRSHETTLALLGYIVGRGKVSFSELRSVFEIGDEELSVCLSKVNEQYYIDISDPKAISCPHIPNRSAEADLDDLDYEVLGYVVLRRLVSITEVAAKLNHEPKAILIIITRAIGKRCVDFSLDVQKVLFRKPEVFVRVNHRPQLVIDLISANNKYLRDPFELEHRKDLFSLVQLRHQTHLSTLINDSRETWASHLSSEEVVRKISLAALDQAFELHMNDEQVITSALLARPDFPREDLVQDQNTGQIDYRSLVGVLDKHKSISLEGLAQELKTPVNNPSSKDLKLFLARLTLHEVIQATLDTNNVLHVDSIDKELLRSSLVIGKTERVIIGILRSLTGPTLKKIASVLHISTKEVKNLLLGLFSEVESNVEISEAGVFTRVDWEDLLLVGSTTNLSRVQKELLGLIMLLGQNTQAILLKDVADIFGLTPSDALLEVLDLVGSGVVSGTFSEGLKSFRLITTQRIQIPDPDEVRSDLTLQSIAQVLTDQKEPLSIIDVGAETDIGWRAVTRALCYFVGTGILPNAHLRDSVFMPGGSFSLESVFITCSRCNNPIDPSVKKCTSCGAGRPTCSICKGYLKETDTILACPHCLNMSHESHIRSWLKLRPNCPTCLRKILESELVIKKW